MKPEKQTTLQGCGTAFEMWSRILTEYAQVSAESEPLLWGQFYSYKFQEGRRYIQIMYVLSDRNFGILV